MFEYTVKCQDSDELRNLGIQGNFQSSIQRMNSSSYDVYIHGSF
jgi:hypothetical protein